MCHVMLLAVVVLTVTSTVQFQVRKTLAFAACTPNAGCGHAGAVEALEVTLEAPRRLTKVMLLTML